MNKNNINCIVGPCPEIYREHVFKKNSKISLKRLPNARILGETSIAFPINPHKSLKKVKQEIRRIKKILLKYV